MTTWVFLALIGVLGLVWALVAILLQNRAQLDVSNAELDTWCRTRIRISVGGATIIASTFEELRSQGLAQARAVGRHFGQAPGGTLPPLVITREMIIASHGAGFTPYAGMRPGDELTHVVLYLDGIPLPWHLPDDGLWFATGTHDDLEV